jgi:hypothetical protein
METKQMHKVLVLEQHSDAERFSIAGWERSASVRRSWNEMVEKFPECVREVSVNACPCYGSSHWKQGKDGRIEIVSLNCDSSD